jgi:hypothetical protein
MSGVTCPKHQTGGGPRYCQQMHTCRCGATVERSKTVEYRTKGWQPRRVCKSCHIEGNQPKSWTLATTDGGRK